MPKKRQSIDPDKRIYAYAAARKNAELDLLITLEDLSGSMKTEAMSVGFYHSELMQRDYQKIQISTIKDLLHGRDL